MSIRGDINNTAILHNIDFEWGSVVEGYIYNTYFKVSVDEEYIPFDTVTEFDKVRLFKVLEMMGLVAYKKNTIHIQN